MNQTPTDYARAQADGLDNIAPTPLQGQQAWQYAQSDNFLSPEEAAAVLRKELEPYRSQIEAKLTQIGYSPEHLAKFPKNEEALFSGQQTGLMNVYLSPDVKIEGRLRVELTEHGPELRFTPSQRTLTIPDEVAGIRLSKTEQEQLSQQGALPRPFMMPDQGSYVPTYLRLDSNTNTVELWRVRPEQLPTKLLGIDLTRDQQQQLANGYPVRLSGLLDRQGEPFDATVNLSPATKGLQLSEFNRLDVALKPAEKFNQQLALNNEGAKTDLTRSKEQALGGPVVSNQQAETVNRIIDKQPTGEQQSPKLARR